MAKNDEDQFQAISSANKICSIKLPYDDQLQKTRYDKTKKKMVFDFEISLYLRTLSNSLIFFLIKAVSLSSQVNS